MTTQPRPQPVRPGATLPAQNQAPQGQQPQQPKAPFQIKKIARAERWLNILIYGDYGTGKTTLAGSAVNVESMREVMFINAEAGDLSLLHHPDIFKIDVTRYDLVARAYEFLRHHCNWRDKYNYATNDEEKQDTKDKLLQLNSMYGIEPREDGEPVQLRTVVLDSLTEVAKYCMYKLLGVNVGVQRLDLEPDSPEFKEWNQSTEMIRLLIRSLRDLPMHVIIVCPEKKEEERPGLMVARLNLTKALANEVPGFLDCVGYLAAGLNDQGVLERKLFLTQGRTWMAKQRFGPQAPAFLTNPTMQDLVNLLPS